MVNVIKVVLSVLLLLCLFKMPYGYYNFVRFCAMLGFGFLMFQALQAQRKQQVWLYGALAVLFQPIFKIVLGRVLWNFIDVVVAIILILSILACKKDRSA